MEHTRREPRPRGREFAQAVENVLHANASKTVQWNPANVETGAVLARRLGVGSDFVSRVLAGQRWPDLNAVPEWARHLEFNPVSLVLIWLRDRAPAAHEVLWEELKRNFGERSALPPLQTKSAELIMLLQQLPAKPRTIVENLIEYLSGLPPTEETEDE